MTPAELRALAKRVCEEQPSRELFLHVLDNLALPTSQHFRVVYLIEMGAFLDAAASAMPEGWVWGVSHDFGDVFSMYVESTRRDAGLPDIKAPTEPQARVAAALLARAADMGARDA